MTYELQPQNMPAITIPERSSNFAAVKAKAQAAAEQTANQAKIDAANKEKTEQNKANAAIKAAAAAAAAPAAAPAAPPAAAAAIESNTHEDSQNDWPKMSDAELVIAFELQFEHDKKEAARREAARQEAARREAARREEERQIEQAREHEREQELVQVKIMLARSKEEYLKIDKILCLMIQEGLSFEEARLKVDQ